MWTKILSLALKNPWLTLLMLKNKPTKVTPQFFIYKHKNKSLVASKMNNLEWDANDQSKDLSKQDKYSLEQLRAMQLVAKMKEAADKCGAGFVGGFVSPTGERFMMSNVDESDLQYQAIQQQINRLQAENLNMEEE